MTRKYIYAIKDDIRADSNSMLGPYQLKYLQRGKKDIYISKHATKSSMQRQKNSEN